MLPVGLIVVLVLIYFFALRGAYYPGEFLLLVIAILAVMLVARMAFRRSRRRYLQQRWEGNESVRILRQRYARGEITKEQFRQMLRDLRRPDDGKPGTSTSGS